MCKRKAPMTLVMPASDAQLAAGVRHDLVVLLPACGRDADRRLTSRVSARGRLMRGK